MYEEASAGQRKSVRGWRKGGEGCTDSVLFLTCLTNLILKVKLYEELQKLK